MYKKLQTAGYVYTVCTSIINAGVGTTPKQAQSECIAINHKAVNGSEAQTLSVNPKIPKLNWILTLKLHST